MNKTQFWFIGLGIMMVISLPQIVSATQMSSNVGTCHIESNQSVEINECDGTEIGGLCSETFYENITFSQPFSITPNVIVTPDHITDKTPCATGATDKIVCYPTQITTTGFRLNCSGSPINGSCEPRSHWRTMATANWMAVDKNPECNAQSANEVSVSMCEQPTSGVSLCKKPFIKRITFDRPFQNTPHVITSAEILSDQGGCVGGATDTLVCNPEQISKEGFTLRCAGSPRQNCGNPYEGWFSKAKAGWIAKDGPDVESANGLEANECNGRTTSGLCSTSFEKHVTFKRAFSTVPQVIVSPEHVSSPRSICALNSMDSVVCHVKEGSVTTTGFIAVCSGSPMNHSPQTVTNTTWSQVTTESGKDWTHNGSNESSTWVPQTTTTVIPPTGCGYNASMRSRALFGYMAIGDRPAQPTTGCIDITKIAKNSDGNTLPTVPEFTFRLDNSNTTVVNDAAGLARLTNVTVGTHTITELTKDGWQNQGSATRTVNVQAGSTCATATFTNQQIVPQNQCIKIQKEIYNAQNQLLSTNIPAFTFQLDNNGPTVQNTSDGIAYFNNVSLGQHTITELAQNGWEKIAPSNTTVTVTANNNCSGIVFKNRQTVTSQSNLTASCIASSNSININNSVTFQATNVAGGTGNYIYSWTGACSGSNSTCTNSFNQTGTHTAHLTVTSGNQIVSAYCPVQVNSQTNNNFDAYCIATPNPAQINEQVSFRAYPSGGTGNYSYQWSNGCNGNSQNCYTSFTGAGTYNASLRVTSGNQVVNVSCPVTINQGQVNNTNNFTITKTVRNLSSGNQNWSNSVFANPGDILQYNVAIQTTGNQNTNIVMLKDTLPSNLIYIDALSIDGVFATGSSNITSGSGISIGNIAPGQTKNIQYRVQVAGTQNFPIGSTTLTNTVLAQDSNGNQRNASAFVMVNKSVILGATDVSTGLTDNFLFDSFFLPLVGGIAGFWLFRNRKKLIF